MKGIVLAGGSGTRLYPVTKAVSKQLLPVFDKPMVYYPISVLMLAGIQEIMVISTPSDIDQYRSLLGNGTQFGVKFYYQEQRNPEGIAQAFHIGKKFIDHDAVCLILGDNIFYGHSFSKTLESAVANAHEGFATVFGYPVSDPSSFGIVEFDKTGNAIGIEEKPSKPKSNLAVTGLYFYPNNVVEKAKKVSYSDRGELEITSINNMYLGENRLRVEQLGRGFAWLDTGTHDSLMDAGQFIHAIERRQGLKVACLEEIGYRNGWISKEQLKTSIKGLKKTRYGDYLSQLLTGV